MSKTFAELNLPEPLQRAIDELGFTELTPVQQAALPRTLAGEDIAGQGRTGTGKTATFLITIFNRLLSRPPMLGRKPHHPRALVIAPTRELVVQISEDAHALGKYAGLTIHTVFGGVDYDKQRKGFDRGVDILIGTPGRLIDYFRQRCYSLRKTEIVVIDEADRMFDLGFIRDLRFLLRRLPPVEERQALLFSATLSYRVLELAYEHMNNPEKVRAEQGEITATGIEESLYHTAMDEKLPLLIHLLRAEDVRKGMIFVNEKRTGERVARQLARYGFKVGVLSGDVRQKKRMRILEDFSEGRLHLLVATDVASRGLHIDGVTHVFNYDLPEEAENYVHRIGRTARAGATGVAVSFCCERFCLELPDIEAYIGRRIPVRMIEPEWLEVGPPTHPDATAEGLRREDRAGREHPRSRRAGARPKEAEAPDSTQKKRRRRRRRKKHPEGREAA